MSEGASTNPGPRKAAFARDQKRATKNPLVAARVKQNLTVAEFTEKVGYMSDGTVRNAEAGTLPPNSPLLPILASAYDLPEEVVQKHQKGKPMSPGTLVQQTARLQTLRATGGMRARQRRQPRQHTKHTNGNGTHAASGVATVRQRGIFKKMDINMRESLRTLTNTVNLHAMKGVKETTVPTQSLVDFLREYYAAKGVEGVIVLDVIFDKLFD